MARKRMGRRPIRLWRKWKKRSWEVMRNVLQGKQGKQRQQEKKLRAAEKRLPDDVFAQHIFPKLSLKALLQIRLTCKRWNRVISSSLLQGIDLKRCMVQVIYSDSGHEAPLALAHNPIEGVWRRILWPSPAKIGSSSDRMSFHRGDGPFVVQVSFESALWVDRRIERPVFVVHNLVTQRHHLLPEPVPVPPSSDCNFDRRLRVFDANQVDYKALLISLVTPRDARYPSIGGHFYTHLYTAATNTWRIISRTEINIGTRANGWSAREYIRPWLRAGCFDGTRFFFLKYNLSPGNFETQIRLWVFYAQEQAWSYIPTDEIYTCGPSYKFRVKYLTCMGKLLAVAPYLDFETTTARGKPSMRFIIFQFLGFPLQGVTGCTRSWRELSRMPQKLTIPELTENFCGRESFAISNSLDFPVVNEVIYIAPAQFRGNRPLKRESVIYNFHDNSWKKLSSVCRFHRHGTGTSMSLASDHAIPCGGNECT